jgi:hypothetical protein
MVGKQKYKTKLQSDKMAPFLEPTMGRMRYCGCIAYYDNLKGKDFIFKFYRNPENSEMFVTGFTNNKELDTEIAGKNIRKFMEDNGYI